MVNRKIDPGIKQRALQLIDEGWEPEEVADVLGVSSTSGKPQIVYFAPMNINEPNGSAYTESDGMV
jgi:hypothetical protein